MLWPEFQLDHPASVPHRVPDVSSPACVMAASSYGPPRLCWSSFLLDSTYAAGGNFLKIQPPHHHHLKTVLWFSTALRMNLRLLSRPARSLIAASHPSLSLSVTGCTGCISCPPRYQVLALCQGCSPRRSVGAFSSLGFLPRSVPTSKSRAGLPEGCVVEGRFGSCDFVIQPVFTSLLWGSGD